MRFSTLILSSLPCLSSFLFSPLSNTFPCLTSVLLFPPTSLLSDWPHLSSPCHASTLLSSLPYSFPLSPHLLPHSLPHSLLSLRLFLCNNNNKIYSLNFYLFFQEFGYIHLSAGDLLREERASGSKNGDLIESYIKEGKIVPVEITISLIEKVPNGIDDHYYYYCCQFRFFFLTGSAMASWLGHPPTDQVVQV